MAPPPLLFLKDIGLTFGGAPLLEGAELYRIGSSDAETLAKALQHDLKVPERGLAIKIPELKKPQPLSEDELMRCLRKLADVRGQAGAVVHDILAREPERLRTLHKLTGGNPRVLALVYQLLERAESDSVFSDLEVLLDQLTPFYKARVEEYRSELQRAIIDAVALHWDPITSHDLAKATEVEITTISSQLTRFKNDGLIEEVPTSGARSGYQLAERFFNIWYLMRHGTRRTRQKMYWLTAFLKNFYAPDELKRMRSEAVIVGQSRPHPLYRSYRW
jgi:DNA-binding transcriptional ArsR family regulator